MKLQTVSKVVEVAREYSITDAASVARFLADVDALAVASTAAINRAGIRSIGSTRSASETEKEIQREGAPLFLL